MKAVEYLIRIKEPHTHIIKVTAIFPVSDDKIIEISLPAWIPGSYLIQDYCKNIINLQAYDEKQKPLLCIQLAKGTWRIEAGNRKNIFVSYDLYAGELHDHSCHLDAYHAHLNGAGLFVFSEKMRHLPTVLTIELPSGWQIATAMDQKKHQKNTYITDNYEELADSLIELGNFDLIEFQYDDIQYSFVICGGGNYKKDYIKRDVTKIVKGIVKMFKHKVPFKRYMFLLHLIPEGIEGLEHLNSTSLFFPAFDFSTRKGYTLFLSLVSHEFFHAWNVKAIRPGEFDHYDYLNEDYTTLLWLSEGITNYYGDLILRREGLWTREGYFKHITTRIKEVLSTPGRKRSSLEKASFETWTRHYQPNENTQNVTVSYYRKGELIGLMLDLEIRRITGNKRSLDDVMRKLYLIWEKEKRGITSKELQTIVEETAGCSFMDFFNNYVAGTTELPMKKYLSYAGLKLEKVKEEKKDEDEYTLHPHIP
ncbi:MAG: hypothetical protein A2161_22625, partial [Candidatus Schekmanbacteria bacterium RBG_13_48_7]